MKIADLIIMLLLAVNLVVCGLMNVDQEKRIKELERKVFQLERRL